jgi:hypothetical protein
LRGTSADCVTSASSRALFSNEREFPLRQPLPALPRRGASLRGVGVPQPVLGVDGAEENTPGVVGAEDDPGARASGVAARGLRAANVEPQGASPAAGDAEKRAADGPRRWAGESLVGAAAAARPGGVAAERRRGARSSERASGVAASGSGAAACTDGVEGIDDAWREASGGSSEAPRATDSNGMDWEERSGRRGAWRGAVRSRTTSDVLGSWSSATIERAASRRLRLSSRAKRRACSRSPRAAARTPPPPPPPLAAS